MTGLLLHPCGSTLEAVGWANLRYVWSTGESMPTIFRSPVAETPSWTGPCQGSAPRRRHGCMARASLSELDIWGPSEKFGWHVAAKKTLFQPCDDPGFCWESRDWSMQRLPTPLWKIAVGAPWKRGPPYAETWLGHVRPCKGGGCTTPDIQLWK